MPPDRRDSLVGRQTPRGGPGLTRRMGPGAGCQLPGTAPYSRSRPVPAARADAPKRAFAKGPVPRCLGLSVVLELATAHGRVRAQRRNCQRLPRLSVRDRTAESQLSVCAKCLPSSFALENDAPGSSSCMATASAQLRAAASISCGVVTTAFRASTSGAVRCNTSPNPLVSLTRTGTPFDSASSATNPKPSRREGISRRAARRRSDSIVSSLLSYSRTRTARSIPGHSLFSRLRRSAAVPGLAPRTTSSGGSPANRLEATTSPGARAAMSNPFNS